MLGVSEFALQDSQGHFWIPKNELVASIKTVLKIDYSRDINEVNYTEVSDSEILSFAKDMSKFSKTDKTKYKVYGIYNSEVTEFDMSGAVYPEDEDAIYLAIGNSTLLMHDAIGVSYGSNLPKRYIKI